MPTHRRGYGLRRRPAARRIAGVSAELVPNGEARSAGGAREGLRPETEPALVDAFVERISARS